MRLCIVLPLCIIFKFSFKWLSAFTVCKTKWNLRQQESTIRHLHFLKVVQEQLTANVIFPNISSGITSSNEQYTNL